MTVKRLHHKKVTVTSYKYIVLKNKNSDISTMSANRRGSQRASLSTDSAPQDGFFVLLLLFFLFIGLFKEITTNKSSGRA